MCPFMLIIVSNKREETLLLLIAKVELLPGNQAFPVSSHEKLTSSG